jgi:NPCBM/NEW2 domain
MPGTRHLAFRVSLMVMALVSGLARGDGPTAPDGPVPSDPIFDALLTDGSTISGQIRRLGEKEGVALVTEQGEEKPVPLDRLVKLTRGGPVPPSTSEESEIVLFPDGDRLTHAKIGSAGEFNLPVHSVAFEDLAIPLDGILGLIFNVPTDPPSADALVAKVRSEPRDSELLWLENGDKLPGLFAGLDDKKLSFQPPTGKLELPRSGVVALGFAQGQVVYRRPEGPFLELTTLDGSRLGVSGVRIERGQIVGTSRFKSEVRLPIGELAQAHVINSSVAYLSDRETNGTIYEPFLGPTRLYRRNLAVTGERLHLGGRVFDRGLGTQSRTYLVYKLEPGSKRFQALIGLDDHAGPLGNVVFKVRVDGEVRFESPPLAAGEPPKLVNLDVTGAKFLILMTEFGERGDVQDHADWVEARIIR